MRKFTGYIVLSIFILIYVVSSYQKLTIKINLLKEKSGSIFRSDKYQYGDLFSLCYLTAFKKPIRDSVKFPNCNYPKKINLYAICDSYIFLFFNSDKFFCGVNNFSEIKTNDMELFTSKLDTSKINVLLLEFSERSVRPLLEDSVYISSLITENRQYLSKIKLKQKIRTIYHTVFNDEINANLEYNTWDYSLFTPVKEFKSNFNFKLFNEVNKDVKISENGKQLFYAPTIDTLKVTSSFKYVTYGELDLLIQRLNDIFREAKNAGFNKVYLSIIPNPVSIIAPNYGGLKYNNLVNRIQNSSQLKMPFVDVFSSFARSQSPVYAVSDTHWSWNGAYIWLDKFNSELIKAIKEKQ